MKIRVVIAVVCLAAVAAIVGLVAANRLRSSSVANSTPANSEDRRRSSSADEIGNGLTGHGAKAGGLGKLLPGKP